MGYYVKYDSSDKTSYNSLQSYGKYFNQVSMALYQIDKNGSVSIEDSKAPEGINLAKKQKKVIYALFANPNFDSNTVHKIIGSESSRQKTVSNIINFANKERYNGINIDFEGIKSKDRTNYNQFIQSLESQSKIHHLKLMVSVPAKSSDSQDDDWSGAYDYNFLGEQADYIQIMTYDESGPWSKPGPISSYDWVNSVLSYSVSTIPSNKILMGLDAYGYDWNLDNSKLNNGVAGKDYFNHSYKWDNKSQSPYYTYTAKDKSHHVVWFENSKSIEAKVSLVKKYRLKGVAVWRLGQENKSFWKSITSALKK